MKALITSILIALRTLFADLPTPAPEPVEPPAVAQPIPLTAPAPMPPLTAAGRALILEFETGGRSGYNPRPEWPGFASGVTIGIGYDLGYNAARTILLDWHAHAQRTRLASVAGITGPAAKPRARELHDILTSWNLATLVFNEVTVARFHALCARTFPGFTALHADAQAAILSVVFNRGNSLAGPRRVEMRAIATAIRPAATGRTPDYAGIAAQLRKMKSLWRGTDIERGMSRRREAEARLVEQAARDAR